MDCGGGPRQERVLIDWLDECCKAWGRSTRWILADTNEGYPSLDTIEKARQGMLSMGTGTVRDHHFREVRLNGALEVAVAMRQQPHMPLPLTATVWAQYVVAGRARNKLPALSRYLGQGISIAEFWRNLDRAHFFLSARIAAPAHRAEPLESHTDFMREISRGVKGVERPRF